MTETTTTVPSTTGAITDPALPAAAVLLGDGATALVRAAVEASGGRLLGLRNEQVLYRPGVELKIRYSVEVAWAGAPPVKETFVAATHVDGPPDGTLHLEADGMTVGLWRHPHDPGLPGLTTAAVPGAVEELLADLLPGPVALDVRVYRPGRRAVVEATTPAGRVFLKVVRPKRARELVARHEALARTLPVPEVLLADLERGIVVLRAIEGASLRERLAAGRGRLPDAEVFGALLDRLAVADLGDLSTRAARRSSLAAADDHVAFLSTVLPTESERLARLREQLGEATTEPVEIVHGDLHEAQIIVGDDGSPVGLLDIDGVGVGARVDDLANLLGHLATYARTQADQAPRIRAYATSLERRFAARVDADELHRRTAASVLGLATGPFRVQTDDWQRETRQRITLAQHHLDRSVLHRRRSGGRARRRVAA